MACSGKTINMRIRAHRNFTKTYVNCMLLTLKLVMLKKKIISTKNVQMKETA
jgi:hypothetical protein